MLRITQNTSASGTNKYFFGYYAEPELEPSKWYGKTAEKLGLSGEIEAKDFEALCHNINPETGEQLTPRNSEKRTVGYDFTFDVPKSVSLIYSQTKDKEILSAFNQAVHNTMTDIEANAETRVRGKNINENRKTENLLWGTFTHGETRPIDGVPDPHLHKHVFIFNATYDEKEERFKAGQFRNLKANAPYFETVFHSHLASNLQAVGYEIERNKNNFEVKGFQKSTLEKFSNRQKQIEEKAKELGITSDKQKDQLGAKTRVHKNKNLDREELKNEWLNRLSKEEIKLIENAKTSVSGGNDDSNKITAKEALEYSLSHNLERKSTTSEKEVITHALKRSYGAVTPAELTKELESRKDLLHKNDKEGNKIFTTKQALGEEQNLKKTAREGRGTLKPINEGYNIKNDKLTAEQANAIQHVLKSKDFITIVSGGAGTGKTWSIKEVAEGVKEKGVNFGAFAPSSSASRQVQREDGFKDATTIAELLKSEKLQNGLKNGVMWIDEAGMVGNKTMNDLIGIAKKQDARILLTGDIKQHNSVERGDALRIIQKYGGVEPARISKIQRQKPDDYRKAIDLISNDKIENGFKALDKIGAIKESDDFESLKNNVANDYLNAVKENQETLIVATTHAQGKAVTHEIREKMKAEKLLAKEKTIEVQQNLSFTDAQKKDKANYQEGLSIQFHQNIKGGFKRGSKYDVSGRDKEGNIILTDKDKNTSTLPLSASDKFSVYEKQKIAIAEGDKIRITQNGYSNEKKRLNNGNILSVKGFDKQGNIIASTGRNEVTIAKDFGNLTHGYYTTSPASQGKSVNKVIVMQGSMSGKSASKEQFYVSASRGKFSISIHTDDKDGLLSSIKRSTTRMTATDIAKAQEPIKKPSVIKDRLKKIGSIYRAVKSKVENYRKKDDNKILNNNPKPVKKVAHVIAPRKGR